MRAFVTLALSALLIFIAASSWLALYPAVPVDLGGARDLDAQCTRVRIPVGGDSLDAWVRVRRTHSVPAVVLMLHGYARDHHRMWRYLTDANEQPAVLVAPDFRSSRAQDRKPTTLGAYELEDARAALDWIERQPQFRRLPVCIFGESLGGAVAIVLASGRPEVAGIAVDSPFANGRMAVEDGCTCVAHVPAEPCATLARSIGRVVTGHDPYALDVVAALRTYGDRPLFLVQSGIEDRFTRRQVTLLENAAGAGTEAWLVADAGHNEAVTRHRSEYLARMWDALRRAALAKLGRAA